MPLPAPGITDHILGSKTPSTGFLHPAPAGHATQDGRPLFKLHNEPHHDGQSPVSIKNRGKPDAIHASQLPKTHSAGSHSQHAVVMEGEGKKAKQHQVKIAAKSKWWYSLTTPHTCGTVILTFRQVLLASQGCRSNLLQVCIYIYRSNNITLLSHTITHLTNGQASVCHISRFQFC